MKCLKEAADSSIPCRGLGLHRKVAGWSEFVKPDSQWGYKLWLEAGCPSAGVLFQLKKHAHRRYKYAVRQVRRRAEYITCNRLAEAMLNILIAVSGLKLGDFSVSVLRLLPLLLTMFLDRITLPNYGATALRSCTILQMVQLLLSC